MLSLTHMFLSIDFLITTVSRLLSVIIRVIRDFLNLRRFKLFQVLSIINCYCRQFIYQFAKWVIYCTLLPTCSVPTFCVVVLSTVYFFKIYIQFFLTDCFSASTGFNIGPHHCYCQLPKSLQLLVGYTSPVFVFTSRTIILWFWHIVKVAQMSRW